MKAHFTPPYWKPIKLVIAVFVTLSSTGCMLGYVSKNGWSQLKILMNREDINSYLKENNPPQEIKDKLNLVLKVRDFCFNKLKLKKTKNYSSYVQLNDQYVSYLLRVAPKYELKTYEWSFPIVGTFPYLGFFDKKDALSEQEKFKEKNYDTYVRGVTAFSTLGWFNDPILSSMLEYNEYDLVDLIIHETIHSTLFIKNNTDFNERLATFLAAKGTEMFYRELEGDNSKTVQKIRLEKNDDQLFSKFITSELELLKQWYKTEKDITEASKDKRIKALQNKFKTEVSIKMKSTKYNHFSDIKLNNARLLPFMTYLADLSEFEKLYQLNGASFHKTLIALKGLEGTDDAMAGLRKLIQQGN